MNARWSLTHAKPPIVAPGAGGGVLAASRLGLGSGAVI
jgi:hypothetical protein